MNSTNFGFQDTFIIRSYESDANHRVSIPTLFNYMQEAAGQHVIRLGVSVTDLLAKGYAWVLMRLKLHLHHIPTAGERIQVITYPSGLEKYYLFRDFQLKDPLGRLIAEASSTWLVIDKVRRSMVTIPDFIRDSFYIPEGLDFYPRLTQRLPKIKHLDEQVEFQVGWHDLDINRHSNNAQYIRWILESVSEDYIKNRQLHEIDVLYRAESLWRDTIFSQIEKIEKDTFAHRLVRVSDNKELG
ncbi:MAG: thioesterase [Microscillaceae bacterium]|nr:thioesterase [Microscillaceae bacterium]